MAPVHITSHHLLAAEIGDRMAPTVGVGGTANSSLQADVKTIVTVCLSIAYAIFGVVAYAFATKCRLFALPEWYRTSVRGLREKVLVTLWFPAVFLLWPLVFSAYLASFCGFTLCKGLGARRNRAESDEIEVDGRREPVGEQGNRDKSNEIELDDRREPAAEQRSSIELEGLERWVDLPLDEERPAEPEPEPKPVPAVPARGLFINPFDGTRRGRSAHSRPRGSEASPSRSPKDTGGRASGAGLEEHPIAWYVKLPLPEKMLRDASPRTSSPATSSSSSSSSSGRHSQSPYDRDGADDNTTPLTISLPFVGEDEFGPDPFGKPKHRLQTIPESEKEEVLGEWEEARLR
ncbi:hypothetical protein CSHISOI_06754 [Colletotrichum shisoi]|uniref:Transmembrane protein n=1 Tax=Colletotrichum shisoi TaxID=2078593 RepID=A0A5Q4BKM2_9PEZI|nr:hypothetical protein CSHISOI_06754 [Colletotrichum shisoi]